MTVTHSDIRAIYTHELGYPHTSTYTLVVFDYKVNLKTEQEWILPWLLSGYPTYMLMCCIMRMRMSSLKLFLMIEMSCTNLHFACVAPPITAPSDDSRPHLKKVLVHRFCAWGQIQAKVVVNEKLITMQERVFWIIFYIFLKRNKQHAVITRGMKAIIICFLLLTCSYTGA